MDHQYVIGIDMGGTNSAIGLVDAGGAILSERLIGTWEYPAPDNFVRRVSKEISEMVREAGRKVELCGIGVGAPNGNFYTGRIEFAPNMPWCGVVDLAGMMEAAIGLPVVLTNDANAAALGEKRFGAAKGLDDFVVITIGTGLGAGIVASGELIYGHSGFAGELGHTIAVYDGRPCSCGRKGCLETYVSARGLRQTFRELLSENGNPENGWHNPDEITAKAIYEAALKGDCAAQRAFEYTGMILGRRLADLVAVLSPEAIFLYGGLSASGDLLLKPAREHMEQNLLKVFEGQVRIELSELKGKSAAIRGAAALAWDVLCQDDLAHEPS